MRPPATIKDWLSIETMFQWVQTAPDESVYKCRMAVWLTHTGRLHAEKVAGILGVSKQAVWLWIRQYNEAGPAGLERPGRGGRRWGYLSAQEEKELLAPILEQTRSGPRPDPKTVQRLVESKLHRKVSKSYIYKLLHRHGWAHIKGQVHPPHSPLASADTFGKLSKPWLRIP
ncbi:MAG: helix-turn-helix domain-containing protein [Phycisphaerae bacterium]|nr:helix-turn-helix domain-containing protein [Phycisphaerae bacterium]